jgi:hypothetical protein
MVLVRVGVGGVDGGGWRRKTDGTPPPTPTATHTPHTYTPPNPTFLPAFDMYGANGMDYASGLRKTALEIGWFAAEASEILPAIFSAAGGSL